MARELQPISCPRCGERQNHLPGAFDPRRVPFGPVFCMACRHQFRQAEYLAGLAAAEQETANRLKARAKAFSKDHASRT